MHGVRGRKGLFTKRDLRKGTPHQYTRRGETCVKIGVATWPDGPQYFKATLVQSNCIKGPGSSLVLFVGTSKSSKGDKPMERKKGHQDDLLNTSHSPLGFLPLDLCPGSMAVAPTETPLLYLWAPSLHPFSNSCNTSSTEPPLGPWDLSFPKKSSLLF